MKWIKKYIKKIIYALSLIIILCIIIYNFTFRNKYATIRYTYTNTSTDKKDITLGFLRTTSDFNKILI